MLSVYYSDVYKKSPFGKTPAGADLINNTDFPNLNLLEYNQLPVERTVRINSVWETIAINKDKHIVLGTNKCSGREMCCSLWGFEKIDKLTAKNSVFRLQINQLITKAVFLSNNLLLAGFRNGAIELWSTHVNSQHTKKVYSLLLFAKQFEHMSPIECLEPMAPTKNQVITGGQDYTLKIWDWSKEDLQCTQTYRYAHINTITGISHFKKNDSIFATCSKDKSVLHWDLRQIKPAQALYLDHDCSFKSISWLNSSNKASEHLLYVGDDDGKLHAIDQRAPKKFLSTDKLFNHSIRNVVCNGNNLAVIANTNTVKVYSVKARKTIYENDSHTHVVRDCVWYDAHKLLTVGCESQMVQHKINSTT